MKLKEFYESIKKDKLTDSQKFFVYQKFLEKKYEKRLFVMKFSPVAKFMAYVFFIMVLFFGQYEIPFIISEKRSLDSLNPNEVMADYIGKIIKVQGKFRIINNGKVIKTDIVSDGDRIILSKDSKIVFDINKTTIAKIVGPADVLIKSIGVTNNVNNYVLNMLEGTYIDIKSDKTSNNNLIVKTKYSDIEPSNLNESTNYSITQENGKQFIQNRGSELRVQKTFNKKRSTVSIKKNQIAKISKDVIFLKEEAEKIALELKNKQIISQFELSGDFSDILTTEENELFNSGSNMSDNSIKVTQYSKNDNFLKPGKNVITVEQTKELELILESTLFMMDTNEFAVRFALGEKNGTQISYSNVIGKLERAYKILGLELNEEIAYKSPESAVKILLQIINNFQKKSQEKYFIGPQLIKHLNNASKLLEVLQNKKFGELQHQEDLSIEKLKEIWDIK